MYRGNIKNNNLEQGFAYIDNWGGTRNMFCHVSALRGLRKHQLEENMPVYFAIGMHEADVCAMWVFQEYAAPRLTGLHSSFFSSPATPAIGSTSSTPAPP